MADKETGKFIQIGQKQIQIFEGKEGAPLVVYHAVQEEGAAIYDKCREIWCPDFSLAVIYHIKWYHEMTPWESEPVFSKGEPCTGGAEEYLEELTEKMLPAVIAQLEEKPCYCALAGYSLAGLFTVYAAFKTDCFAKAASISGSLWYPDILSYIESNVISKNLKAIYFSLGDKESHTKNPLLSQVEENTRRIAAYFDKCKITTIFEKNSGNHYQNAELRIAKGIKWLLNT